MRRLLPLVSLALSACHAAAPDAEWGPGFKRAEPLAVRSVTATRDEVPRYARQELTIDLAGTWDNPFDPDDIDLSATFHSPSGAALTLPGFLSRPYARERQGQAERLKPAGPPVWLVRFAPAEVGEYSYTVTARDRSGAVTSPAGRFRSVAGASGGYVRISRDDPRYFALDDGRGWFAIGANVCWPRAGGTYDYDDWFAGYAAAGGNYARLWIGPFDVLTLEKTAQPNRDDTGLGRYDLADAWRLDYVTELAERLGIRLMFCIDSFNSLRSHPDYNTWHLNPYNAANGGPLAKPEEFFTNETARKTFRHRLRYLAARWGYSTSLLSWEFWNEVDIIDKYVSPEVAAWHQEMSRYLRATDPWKHLQTTSYARSEGDPAVDGLPEMDYVQTHRYGARDIAAGLADWSQRKARFGKPHYVGEFGLSGGGSEAKVDPAGVSLHNGLWATVMSGDAGTGMLWWWDNYIHPLNLYHHFAALHAYLDGVDFPREHFRPLAAAAVEWEQKPAAPSRVDLELSNGVSSWSASPANQPNTFVCGRDGKVQGLERLSYVMHGVRNHKDKHNPATFELDCGAETEFTVVVRAVSGHGGAALKVTLDGATVLEKDFADPDDTQDTTTLAKYDGSYTVAVPAGKHTVVVENTGRDWFMADYVVRRYVEDWQPRLRALALAGDRLVLAWVQHRDHTWSKLAEGPKPEAVAGTRLRLPGLAGRWRAERWDTNRGVKLAEETVTAAGGAVTVKLPDITEDGAVKLVHLP
ncbi:MAG: DUF5060 domain-containing protein [Armatimonadetes bacterium]|nr:DUF5060 domain-containing protein [Armatimonadota bacterium]